MSQFVSPPRDLVGWRESQPHVDAAPPYVAYRSRQSRWTFPPSALGWLVLAVAWPLLEMALDKRLVDDWTAVVVLLTCTLLPVGLLLADPIRRFAGILWAFLLAYTGAAFFVRYAFDLSYFPFVSDEVFDQTALAAMRAFDLSFIVFFPFLRESWCRASIAAHARAINQVATTSRRVIVCICALLVILGTIDWVTVARIGLDIIAESGRRRFSDALVLASDHNVQVVAIPITILALICAWRASDRLLRMVVFVCVGFAWFPSFLAGSRKEVFIICIAFLPIVLSRPVSNTTRLLVGAAGIGFIAIPILFDGEIVRGFQEFILPYYNVVSVNEYPDYLRPTTPFFSGIQLLLPSFLRATDARVFGSDLSDLMAALGQNVSYGGQPYAEALAYTAQTPALMFLMSNAILFGTCFLLARINSIYTIIAFPYLALWGRSILWVTLFFILYGGLILILLGGRGSRGGTRATAQNDHMPALSERTETHRSLFCLN
jgi:hypothetical protein